MSTTHRATSVYLPPELLARLNRVAPPHRGRRDRSDLIRRALAAELDRIEHDKTEAATEAELVERFERRQLDPVRVGGA